MMQQTKLETHESGLNDSNVATGTIDLGVKQRNRFEYFASNSQGSQGSQMRIESNQGPFAARNEAL